MEAINLDYQHRKSGLNCLVGLLLRSLTSHSYCTHIHSHKCTCALLCVSLATARCFGSLPAVSGRPQNALVSARCRHCAGRADNTLKRGALGELCACVCQCVLGLICIRGYFRQTSLGLLSLRGVTNGQKPRGV